MSFCLFFSLADWKKRKEQYPEYCNRQHVQEDKRPSQTGKEKRDMKTETPYKMNLFSIAGVFSSWFCSFNINLEHKVRTINVCFPY